MPEQNRTVQKNNEQSTTAPAHLSHGLVHVWVELQGHLHQGPYVTALGICDARHVESIVQREKRARMQSSQL